MSSTSTGKQAEAAVARLLMRHGYKLLAQNWRTRWCEIDLILKNSSTIYFIEVKYRSTAQWGSGFDYVTPRKVRRMRFAAEMWVAAHNWTGLYQLAAAEVTGTNFRIVGFTTL